jgi:hypothetical protein
MLNQAGADRRPAGAGSAVKRRFEVKRMRRDFARFDAGLPWHTICGAA